MEIEEPQPEDKVLVSLLTKSMHSPHSVPDLRLQVRPEQIKHTNQQALLFQPHSENLRLYRDKKDMAMDSNLWFRVVSAD